MTYIDPFTDPRWKAMRTDQGVDWGSDTAALPVEAIGDGTITYSSTSSGWPGGAALIEHLSSGPHAGENIYVAEHLANLLPVGTQVTAGQQIATALAGYPYTEWGEAASATNDTPIATYSGAPDGTPMPGGLAMARFMRELGAVTAQDPGPGPDWLGSPAGAASTGAGAVSAGGTTAAAGATATTVSTAGIGASLTHMAGTGAGLLAAVGLAALAVLHASKGRQ